MQSTITPEIWISIIAVIISTAALVCSWIVAQKQLNLGQEQLKLEKITAELSKKQLELLQIEEISKTKSKLNVTVQPLGKNHCFYITNTGNVDIYNLNFEFINNKDYPLPYSLTELFPHPKLTSGENLPLLTAFTDDSASRYTVKLSWQDEQGNPFEEIFYPTR